MQQIKVMKSFLPLFLVFHVLLLLLLLLQLSFFFSSSPPPRLLLFSLLFFLTLLVTVTAAINRVLVALVLPIMCYHYCCDPPASVQSELDESMQQIQVENARLEAELKYEKQRADMLHQDLQDSQKVSK